MSNKRVNPFKLKVHLLECEIDEKDKKISDLQAKLAESEKEVEFLKEDNEINKKDADYYFDEYRLCKHQLAEKEKQILELQEQSIRDNQIYNEELTEKDKEIEELKLDNKKYFTESCRTNKEIAYKLKQQNQKAIEQLEKVKTQCEFDISFACDEQEQRLYDFINQQINELKGKVEDE